MRFERLDALANEAIDFASGRKAATKSRLTSARTLIVQCERIFFHNAVSQHSTGAGIWHLYASLKLTTMRPPGLLWYYQPGEHPRQPMRTPRVSDTYDTSVGSLARSPKYRRRCFATSTRYVPPLTHLGRVTKDCQQRVPSHMRPQNSHRETSPSLADAVFSRTASV